MKGQLRVNYIMPANPLKELEPLNFKKVSGVPPRASVTPAGQGPELNELQELVRGLAHFPGPVICLTFQKAETGV